VHSSSIVTPDQVSGLQQSIEDKIDRPVELIVRSKIARDISALHSTSQVTAQGLDGHFVDEDPHPRVLKARMADTAIRAVLSKRPGFELTDVRLLTIEGKDVVLASLLGVTVPPADWIRETEKMLRRKLGDPGLSLLVRLVETRLFNRRGLYRTEISGLSYLDAEQQSAADRIVALVKKELGDSASRMLEASGL
jgi:hypothetical protein